MVKRNPALGTVPPRNVINEQVVNDTAIFKRIVVKYTQTVTTTVTTMSTTLFNHHYNKPLTCFRPDKPGAYVIELAVTDGCTSTTSLATITAACPPPVRVNMNLGGSSSSVTFDGKQFKRVLVDARTIRPNSDKDTLTYSFVLSAPTNSRTVLTNPHGNQASFVPDMAGPYTVTLFVEDGCNPAQNASVSVDITCGPQAQRLSADVQVSVGTPGTYGAVTSLPEISYTTNGFDRHFKLTGKSSNNCLVKSRRWYLSRRECTSESSALAPTIAVTPGACPDPFICTWHVTKFPCNKQQMVLDQRWKAPFIELKDNVGTKECAEEGCEMTLIQGTAPVKCDAHFECRSPGTYTLELTVTDGCQISKKQTSVICRCAVRATITLSDQIVVRSCDTTGAAQQFLFAERTIVPAIDTSTLPRLDSCPAGGAAAPTPAAAPAERCCPAHPPCPQCPRCPNERQGGCPACPSAGLGSIPRDAVFRRAGTAKFRPTPEGLARLAAKGGRSLLSTGDSTDLTMTTVMGLQIPMVGVLVASLLVNFILLNKIRSRRASRKSCSLASEQ